MYHVRKYTKWNARKFHYLLHRICIVRIIYSGCVTRNILFSILHHKKSGTTLQTSKKDGKEAHLRNDWKKMWMFSLEYVCKSMMAVFKYLKYCPVEKGPHFLRKVSENETIPTGRSYSKPIQLNVKTLTNLLTCLWSISAQYQGTLPIRTGQKEWISSHLKDSSMNCHLLDQTL